MIDIYFIGGSPCSGKSTIVEELAKKYDLYYFKVDDYLDKYTEMGASKGYNTCLKQNTMSSDEIWLRDPLVQCEEELSYYKEIFEFIKEDLSKTQSTSCKKIITEGAAYLPELVKKLGISPNRYISITPSKDFQVSHYSKREWVPYVLEKCTNKEKAFSNWMNRDCLFARKIEEQCVREGYASILNDGSISIQELIEKIATHFEISKL